ncbi:hypothetical protein FEM48_Zijuj07G0063000 [Ziziphus jujuba var. spinosa]|uniref:GTP-eEF1A C-terminal domain-containing protein n=1 Tax=Ziziphus jujuba var. spinosa TaxID=714518 RepID=A0A978V2Z1_ZIZJJ|nr:hypothetical protein FEM48_Zijuj07G0063000 [Ziziphus jujuba var. spinosa]
MVNRPVACLNVICKGDTKILACHTYHGCIKFVEIMCKVDWHEDQEEVKEKPHFLEKGDVGIVKMVPMEPMVVEAFPKFPKVQEYWQVVSEGIAEPVAGIVWTDAQKAELEAQKLKDLKAKNYLFQAIDSSILETILNKDTSKQIWDSMKKKYQRTARAKRVQHHALGAEFENLKMKSGESVLEYFSRMMAIANKMRIHGEKLEDVTIVEKILQSMTVKFNFVVCSIKESKDIDTLSIDELQNSLLLHEQKLSKQDQEEQVLQAETKGVWHDRDRGECSERSNFAEKKEEISLLMVSHIQEETNENLWNTVKFGDNSTVSVMVNFDSEDEGDNGQQVTLEVSAEIQNIPDIPQRNQVTATTQLDVAAGS